MGCSHERVVERYVQVEDWYGHVKMEREMSTESTTEDIDLHRYRCTLCGLVMYYSGRAREYHENGVKCHIPGLE